MVFVIEDRGGPVRVRLPRDSVSGDAPFGAGARAQPGRRGTPAGLRRSRTRLLEARPITTCGCTGAWRPTRPRTRCRRSSRQPLRSSTSSVTTSRRRSSARSSGSASIASSRTCARPTAPPGAAAALTHLSLDFPGAEQELTQISGATASDAERFFHDETVRFLFGRVVDSLRSSLEREGRDVIYRVFEQHDLSPGPDTTYATVAGASGPAGHPGHEPPARRTTPLPRARARTPPRDVRQRRRVPPRSAGAVRTGRVVIRLSDEAIGRLRDVAGMAGAAAGPLHGPVAASAAAAWARCTRRTTGCSIARSR